MREPVRSHAPVRGAKAYLAARSDGRRLHAGIDLAAPRGTLVVAPEKAQVLIASDDAEDVAPVAGWAWSGYGPGIVVLQGASGAYHVLAHVERVACNPGDIVDEGVPLAVVSNRAHVHWEVRSSLVPPRGAAVVETTTDPSAWLAGAPRLYAADVDGCPAHPTDDHRTPWACRPTSTGGAPFILSDFSNPAPVVPVARRTRAAPQRQAQPQRSGDGWLLALLGLVAYAVFGKRGDRQ